MIPRKLPPDRDRLNLPRIPGIVRDNLVYLPFFLAVSVVNYLLQVYMARSLVPGHYAAFVASLSLLAILASPGAIISNLSARTVSIYWSAGSFARLRRLLGRMWVAWGSFSVLLSLIFVALSGLIARMLSIDSVWVVLWAAIAVAPAMLLPLLAGMLQGARSFGLLGALGAIGAGSRLAVGLVLVGLGFGAAGAVAASPIAGFVAVAAGYAGWRWLVRGKSDDGDGALEVRLPVRDQLKVAAIGAVQIILFNLDILFVKGVFDEQIAADYSAAALIGRTVFFAASPLATVLLPNVIHNAVRGKNSLSIFLFSLASVVGLCLIGVLIVFSVPGMVYRLVFSDVYVPYADVLRAYAISGLLLSVLMLLATFHIGVSNLRIWLPMCVLLPLPIGSYAFFHATPGQIAWGMVASLAVYNVYIVWETIRFLTGKIVRASPQETTALGHPS